MGIAGFTSALIVWEGILRLAVETSQGMNDHSALGKSTIPKEPTPKSPGECRILMLGDSFTRADEVSDGLAEL